MQATIRQERETDYRAVAAVVAEAFAGMDESDKQEHLLVERLRRGAAFIAELSLVAEISDVVVGHALFTRLGIDNSGHCAGLLALAPVSVRPDMQRRGVGTALIQAGLERARGMAFRGVVVLGHSDYYPRFGFRQAGEFKIRAPFEADPANFMALPLSRGALDGIEGVVRYAPEFSP